MTQRFTACFTVLLALFFCFGTVKAQIFGGVKTGLNLSKVASDAATQAYDVFKPGFMGGLIIATPLDMNGKLILNTDLSYANKGMKTKLNGNTSLHSMHYFELPVFLRGIVYTHGDDGIRAFINGGPYVAANMGSGTKNQILDDEETFVRYEKASRFRGFDAGLGIGIGATYPLPGGYLSAEARYAFGFVNLNDQFLNRNRVLNFSISYFCDIEKFGINYKDWVIFPQKSN